MDIQLVTTGFFSSTVSIKLSTNDIIKYDDIVTFLRTKIDADDDIIDNIKLIYSGAELTDFVNYDNTNKVYILSNDTNIIREITRKFIDYNDTLYESDTDNVINIKLLGSNLSVQYNISNIISYDDLILFFTNVLNIEYEYLDGIKFIYNGKNIQKEVDGYVYYDKQFDNLFLITPNIEYNNYYSTKFKQYLSKSYDYESILDNKSILNGSQRAINNRITFHLTSSDNTIEYLIKGDTIYKNELVDFFKDKIGIMAEFIKFIYCGQLLDDSVEYKSPHIYIISKNSHTQNLLKKLFNGSESEPVDESEIENNIETFEDNIELGKLIEISQNDRVQYMMRIINEKPKLLQIVNQYILSEPEFIDISTIEIPDIKEYDSELKKLIPFVQNIFNTYQIPMAEIEVCKLLQHFNRNVNMVAKYIVQHIIHQKQ